MGLWEIVKIQSFRASSKAGVGYTENWLKITHTPLVELLPRLYSECIYMSWSSSFVCVCTSMFVISHHLKTFCVLISENVENTA